VSEEDKDLPKSKIKTKMNNYIKRNFRLNMIKQRISLKKRRKL